MKQPAGRPAVNVEPATDRIQVRVTAAQRLEVRRIADANGTTVSGLMREAIDEIATDCRDGPRLFRRPRRRR